MSLRPLASLLCALLASAALALATPAASAEDGALTSRGVDLPPTTGLIVGDYTHSYETPWTSSRAIERLPEFRSVTIVGIELGENWIVGDQRWPMAIQDWGNVWYRLADGSYVYSAFVFVPRPGETPPLREHENPDRYVVLSLSEQTAWAMIGPNVAHQMLISTGKGGFDTPTGPWRVISRITNERMTSTAPGDSYDVQRVLFTQYFAPGGFALHLNYWQPYNVFGGYASSHGCVGLLLHDAQWLWLFAREGTQVFVRE